MARQLEYLNKSTPRVDALERVTGQAHYAEDLALPGMLFARVLRSPYPHARIKSIDTTAAEAHPGVRAILHSKNTNVKWSSGDAHGRRRVFADPARFVGEPIAAVAAVDRHVAEEALALIRVDYEELPHVLTVDQALKAGAPKIHPEGNVDAEVQRTKTGNIDEGFRQAEFVYENDFLSKHQNNAQLERRVSMAQWEGGKLTVWASTQGIYNCRGDIARDLQLPLSKVRVICQYMGGGFGNKNMGFDFDLIAALLAQKTRRPVRVEFNRHEDFIGVHGRWATQQHYRIGYKKDGTLTAIDFKNYSNMGAYLRSGGGADGSRNYNVPNVNTESYRVHTNTTCGANYRAPGGPQGVFSIESAMDDIAAKLGMDPVELRLKNIPRDKIGNRQLSSNGLPECIRRGAEVIGWTEKRRQYAQQAGPIRRGVGMAIGTWSGGAIRPSSAAIKILQDGSVKVMVGVTDVGTGAKTVMGLIAAEALGIPPENISVVWGDTDLVPYSTGESGSSTTNCTGTAVIEAAKQAREQLLRRAATHFKMRREDLDLRGGRIMNLAKPGQSWTIAESVTEGVERFDRSSWPDVVSVSVNTEDVPDPAKIRMTYAVHFADVEVNTETGKVKVLRYVAAHDSGTIVNQLLAGSQVKGGVVQGIGMALREELIWDRQTGRPINNHYHGAKPLIHPEVPDVEVIFVDVDEPFGPFGAKTLGEVTIVPAVGTIANAIYHATGVRLRELPMTPDKILNALRTGGQKTGEQARGMRAFATHGKVNKRGLR